MKNGYEQFFSQARRASQGEGIHSKKNSAGVEPIGKFTMTEKQIEERLKGRSGLSVKKKKRAKTPWGLILFSAFGLILAGGGLLHSDKIENFLKRIEISFLGSASAAGEPVKEKSEESAKATATVPLADSSVAARAPGSSDIDHLAKLSDREKELNARSEDLSRQEAEIAKMKEELDRRLRELESMRTQISDILAERVKIDAERVETLVQMYSNMKPPQAAKIFESLDEDLAVELLSRMKKKNAADIMNLLPPEKAQTFSERYAGYRRK